MALENGSENEILPTQMLPTQSQSTQNTWYVNSDDEFEPWARLVIKKVKIQRLGLRATIRSQNETSEIELNDTEFTAGRLPSNDFCFTAKNCRDLLAISSIQFRIKKDLSEETNPVIIEDCSSNGTYLNRHKIGQNQKRVLRDNDIITANGCDLKFQFKSYHVIHNDLPKKVGIEDRYHIGKKIGSGGCGQVYLAFDCETIESYAMKVINRKLYAENSLTTMTNEATILRTLQHPCIIQLHEIVQARDTIVIVLEYMEGGDLMQRIIESAYINEDLMKFYFYQICHGIMYMHDNNVTHRDLKPDNILLATNDKYTTSLRKTQNWF